MPLNLTNWSFENNPEIRGFVNGHSSSNKQPQLRIQSSRGLEEVRVPRSGCATGRQETQTLLLLFQSLEGAMSSRRTGGSPAPPDGPQLSGLTG